MQSKGTGMVERCRSSAALRCTHRRHAPSVAATADLRCREVDRSAHQHTLQVPEYTDRRDALASLFRSLSVFVRCARARTHTHMHTHTHTHTRRTGSRQASSPWHPPRRVPTVFPRPSRATGLLARPARAPVGRPRSTRACFRESRQTPLCQIGLIRTN